MINRTDADSKTDFVASMDTKDFTPNPLDREELLAHTRERGFYESW
jgi:hypothetical protein